MFESPWRILEQKDKIIIKIYRNNHERAKSLRYDGKWPSQVCFVFSYCCTVKVVFFSYLWYANSKRFSFLLFWSISSAEVQNTVKNSYCDLDISSRNTPVVSHGFRRHFSSLCTILFFCLDPLLTIYKYIFIINHSIYQ